MRLGRRAATAGLAAALALPLVPAHAAIAPTPGTAAALAGTCLGVQAGLGQASRTDIAFTKSAAILGGAPSALDAIRAQQSFAPLVSAPKPSFADAGRLTIVLPGVDTSLAPAAPCDSSSGSRIVTVRPPVMAPGLAAPIAAPATGENFLASQRVRIKRTHFDADWRRVRSESISRTALKRYLGALPADETGSLSAVNAWVNKRIAYAEDRAVYGTGDYWAGARRTLRTGKGDCEDIALTKMALLAAAGIPRDAMILTVTRDLVRNQDHAVLIVRTGAGYRMLDDATDAVLDAMPRSDYRAIVSLGARESWLHGA